MYEGAVPEILVTSDGIRPEKKRGYEERHFMGVAEQGTGRILTISPHGLSFGCLCPRPFPDEWLMDLLDNRGAMVQKIRVRKMWECRHAPDDASTAFSLTVGVEYVELTSEQSRNLSTLLGDNANVACVPTLELSSNTDQSICS